ncbi:hypothetical protein [Lacisediminihabitans profunda]|uniref:Uncharacterized protein n=1 Tax=Lacisediminihabitans profunda TaxID=2594790 RepID=A0A5C8UW80_9MICO|nr:hypothetical protein [Lacisediminihabitans profunda]TXN32306.1 hypothetical protein FVP33_01365 [Lacisediminihabitans profunda]
MKLSPQAAPHIYADTQVTLERVLSFGNATREIQLTVLTELRLRANDHANDTQIALVAVFVSFVGFFVSPIKNPVPEGAPLWTSLVVGAVLGIGGAIVAIPFLLRPVLRSLRKERATVWIPAFEDEIARRRGDITRQGRDWRRTH